MASEGIGKERESGNTPSPECLEHPGWTLINVSNAQGDAKEILRCPACLFGAAIDAAMKPQEGTAE